MLAALCIIFSIIAGWSLVRLLPLSLRRLEALSMSITVGFSLVAWLVFLCAKPLGFSLGLPLALIAAVLICTTQLFIKPTATFNTKPYATRFRILSWVAAVAIAYILGQLVVLSYQFPAPNGSWISNGNAWGDAPLHVTYINQFSLGNTVDLVSPSYQKVPLTYPFIADFYSGVLRRLGGDWTISLMVPSLLILLALTYLVFSFGYRLLGSARAAWFQLLFLVFSGALQGGWQLTQVLFTQGLDAYNKLIGVSIPFATGDNYLNFFHSHPIPQRAYLFGMPLLIVILTAMLEMYRNQAKPTWLQIKDLRSKANLLTLFATPQARRQWLTGGSLILTICIGMMPLVHVHSFLIFLGLFGLATLGLLIVRRALPKPWLVASLGGILLAAPQVLWQFRSTYDEHFHSWIHGWMLHNFSPVEHGNLLTYWFSQIGFLLVIMLLGWWWLKRLKASPPIWLFLVAGIGIFLICNVYVFQPSIWDNMKLFEYAFWFEMLVTGYILAAWSRQRLNWLFIIPITLSLTIMGFYTLVLTGPQLTFELLSKDEVTFGAAMHTELPQDAYVLVGDRHNHPITMLSDHKVLMTYAGWYNLYDSKWPNVLRDRTAMLHGDPTALSLLGHYGITHAVFSDSEVTNAEADLNFYQAHFTEITHQAGWWVFDIRKPI